MSRGILCAGEILYDFLSKNKGRTLGESMLFEKRPGGSPLNVAVALSRLGVPVEFVGVVGNDTFGKALIKYLKKEKIGLSYLRVERGAKTVLAFASIDESGKPDFEIYQDISKKLSLSSDDIEKVKLNEFSAFHFGSISLVMEAIGDSIEKLFQRFKDKTNAVTFLDPNIRPSFIPDKKKFIEALFRLIRSVDVLKLSDEDLHYITGEVDIEKSLKLLRRDGITFITRGKIGCTVSAKGKVIQVPGFNVKVVETTGCGDAFMAGIIYRLYNIGRNGLDSIDVNTLEDIGRFSNAVAALVATRYGASTSMPTMDEVQEMLQRR